MVLVALALSLFQQAAPAKAADAPFTSELGVLDVVRLARTPVIDGKIGNEEWDAFKSDAKVQTYHQWEPGKIYLASKAPLDQDIVWSIDLNGDGWGKGSDNYEIRCSYKGGKPVITTKSFTASKDGSGWSEAVETQASAQVAATADQTSWTIEVAITNPGEWVLKRKGSKVGLRVDAIPSNSPSTEGIINRNLPVLQESMERSAGTLAGFSWTADYGVSNEITSEEMRCRVGFKGDVTMDLKRLTVRGEGESRDTTTEVSLPFPELNNKGKSYFDYGTSVGKNSTVGYRVLRMEIRGSDGVPSVLQSSWRVAPLVDFEIVKPVIPFSDAVRRIDFTFYIQSNSLNRLDGVCVINAPSDWKVISGDEKSFLIYRPRTKIRRKMELEIPAGASGVFPVKLKAIIGARIVEHTHWIYIQPK